MTGWPFQELEAQGGKGRTLLCFGPWAKGVWQEEQSCFHRQQKDNFLLKT